MTELTPRLRKALGEARCLWHGEALGAGIEGFAPTGTPRLAIADDGRLYAEDAGGLVRGLTGLFGAGKDAEAKVRSWALDPARLRVGLGTVGLGLGAGQHVRVLLSEGLTAALRSTVDDSAEWSPVAGVALLREGGEGTAWCRTSVRPDGTLTTSAPAWHEEPDAGALVARIGRLDDGVAVLRLAARTVDGSFTGLDELEVRLAGGEAALIPAGDEIEGLTNPQLPPPVPVLVLSRPIRLAGQEYLALAVPVLSDALAETLDAAIGSAGASVGGDFVRLQAEVTGQLEGATVASAAGHLLLTSHGLGVTSGDASAFITEQSLLHAVAEGDDVYLRTRRSALWLRLEDGVTAEALAWHPVIRQGTSLARDPDLLAAVRVGDEDLGICLVELDGGALQLTLPAEGGVRRLELAGLKDVLPGPRALELPLPGGTVRLQSTDSEIAELLHGLLEAYPALPPRLVPGDYRHPDEFLHEVEARQVIELLPHGAVRERYETDIEPAELPDLIGKALRVGPSQLSGLYGRLQAICGALGIDVPPTYVYDAWQITADAVGLARPRLEFSSRMLTELSEGEQGFLLARNCAHVALGHTTTEVLGEQALKLLAAGGTYAEGAVQGAGGLVGGVLGGVVGSVVGAPGAMAGANLGRMIGSRVAVLGASEADLYDAQGDLMIRRAQLYRWFRTATLTADAFGLVWVGSPRVAVSAILMTIFNNRQVVDEIDLPLYLAQVEEIEGVEGDAAIYSRLDEVLPYGPHRIAALLGYGLSRRGADAIERARRIRTGEKGRP